LVWFLAGKGELAEKSIQHHLAHHDPKAGQNPTLWPIYFEPAPRFRGAENFNHAVTILSLVGSEEFERQNFLLASQVLKSKHANCVITSRRFCREAGGGTSIFFSHRL
jgi:hypothetical protein